MREGRVAAAVSLDGVADRLPEVSALRLVCVAAEDDHFLGHFVLLRGRSDDARVHGLFDRQRSDLPEEQLEQAEGAAALGQREHLLARREACVEVCREDVGEHGVDLDEDFAQVLFFRVLEQRQQQTVDDGEADVELETVADGEVFEDGHAKLHVAQQQVVAVDRDDRVDDGRHLALELLLVADQWEDHFEGLQHQRAFDQVEDARGERSDGLGVLVFRGAVLVDDRQDVSRVLEETRTQSPVHDERLLVVRLRGEEAQELQREQAERLSVGLGQRVFEERSGLLFGDLFAFLQEDDAEVEDVLEVQLVAADEGGVEGFVEAFEEGVCFFVGCDEGDEEVDDGGEEVVVFAGLLEEVADEASALQFGQLGEVLLDGAREAVVARVEGVEELSDFVLFERSGVQQEPQQHLRARDDLCRGVLAGGLDKAAHVVDAHLVEQVAADFVGLEELEDDSEELLERLDGDSLLVRVELVFVRVEAVLVAVDELADERGAVYAQHLEHAFAAVDCLGVVEGAAQDVLGELRRPDAREQFFSLFGLEVAGQSDHFGDHASPHGLVFCVVARTESADHRSDLSEELAVAQVVRLHDGVFEETRERRAAGRERLGGEDGVVVGRLQERLGLEEGEAVLGRGCREVRGQVCADDEPQLQTEVAQQVLGGEQVLLESEEEVVDRVELEAVRVDLGELVCVVAEDALDVLEDLFAVGLHVVAQRLVFDAFLLADEEEEVEADLEEEVLQQLVAVRQLVDHQLQTHEACEPSEGVGVQREGFDFAEEDGEVLDLVVELRVVLAGGVQERLETLETQAADFWLVALACEAEDGADEAADEGVFFFFVEAEPASHLEEQLAEEASEAAGVVGELDDGGEGGFEGFDEVFAGLAALAALADEHDHAAVEELAGRGLDFFVGAFEGELAGALDDVVEVERDAVGEDGDRDLQRVAFALLELVFFRAAFGDVVEV